MFRVVKDYFCGLPMPLMTYEMYEVVTNIFGMYFVFDIHVQIVGFLTKQLNYKYIVLIFPFFHKIVFHHIVCLCRLCAYI